MVERVFRGIAYTVETAPANDQTLNGTPNPDWIEALGGDNRVSTGAGNDVVLAGVDFSFILPTYPPYNGAAIFYSSLPDAGNNTIFTGAGDDYVATAGGIAFVRLGEGNDIFDGAGSSNGTVVYGGAGDDILDIGSGNGKLIRAGAGNDTIYGGAGEDVGAGDILDGGAGEDFLNLRLFDQTGNVFNGSTAINDLFLAYGITIRNVEAFGVIGNIGNDTLTGGAGDDSLDGGFGGNDLLRGSAGNDTLTGGTGDTLNGGAGEDFLSLDLSDQAAGILFNGTASTHLTLADGTTARNGEAFDVFGGSGNDTLTGGAGDDSLDGGLGNDSLRGGAGDDFLSGNDGNDILRGGTGIDILFGGDGNDTLTGGAGDDFLIRGDAGNDSVFGGAGDDRVLGGDGNDSVNGGAGNDIIFGVDFDLLGVGDVDTLTGGSGSDLFGLGDDFGGVFYDSDQVNSPASTDYAQITDFNFSQDRIQLTGAASNYSLVEGMVPNTGLSGTSIYLAGQTNELIGVVTDVTGLDLNASYFSYVVVV